MRGRNNYTRQSMETWADSLVQLPKEIAGLEAALAADKNQLGLSQQQLLDLKENQIVPTRLLITRLIAKIELSTIPPQIQTLNTEAQQLTSQADALDAPISEIKNAIKPVEAELVRIKRLIAIKDLLRRIADLGHEITQLSEDCSREERDLAIARGTLSSIESSMASQSSQVGSLQLSKTTILAAIESIRHSVIEVDPVMVHSGGVGVVTSTPVTVQSGGVSVVSGAPIYSGGVQATVHTHHHHHHDHHDYHTAELERQLRDIDSQIDDCERSMRRIRSQHDDAQYKIRQIEGHIERFRRDIREKQNQKREWETQYDRYGSNEQQQARRTASDDLNREYRAQEAIFTPLQRKLDGLLAEQRSLNSQASSRRSKIRQLESRKDECVRLTADFVVSLDTPLEQQRDTQQSLLEQLDTDKRKRERDIQALHEKISATGYEIHEKKNKLAANETNQFLRTLKYTPQALLDKLEIDIYQSIRTFENEHPEEQNDRVRRCLVELQYKIPFLKSAPLSVQDDITLARDRYFLLCGLLRDMQAKLYYGDILDNRIVHVLQNQDIDLDGARAEYQALKLRHPRELVDLTVDDLARMEKEAYLNSRNAFNALLARIRTSTIPELNRVKELGEQLSADIQAKEKAAEKAHLAFDNKYYTGLFNLASQLLKNPTDINLHIAYRAHMSHHPDETPSCGFKAGGIAMMFFGAVLTAAAAIVAIFGFPIGTPLYVSLPVAGAGVAMILTGVGLFRHGCNKGLPGKLNEFVDECDKQKSRMLIEETGEKQPLLDGPGSYNLKSSAPGMDV